MPSINTELGERALSKMQHEMDWKPLKERCLRVYPTWSSRHVDRILREYQRFLALKVATRDIHDTIVLAPVFLDAMWKQHILSTQQYYGDCQMLLQSNQVLHYNADAAINVSHTIREKRMELTKASLCMMFAGSTLSSDAKGIWDYNLIEEGPEQTGTSNSSELSDDEEDDDGDHHDDDGHHHLLEDINEDQEREIQMPPSPRSSKPRNLRKDQRTRSHSGNNHPKPTRTLSPSKAQKQHSQQQHQQQQQQSHHKQSKQQQQLVVETTENKRHLYIYRAGKVSKFSVYPSETILHIKSRIQRKLGIAPAKQYLEWDGIELEEQRTIAQYGIPTDATLVLSKLRSIPSHPSIHTESLMSGSKQQHVMEESQTATTDHDLEDHHRHHHHHRDSLDEEERDDHLDDIRPKRRGRSSTSRPVPITTTNSNPNRPPKPPRQQPPSPTSYASSDHDSFMTSPSQQQYPDPRRRQQALLNKLKIQNHNSQQSTGDVSSLEHESTLPSRPRPKKQPAPPPPPPPPPIDVFVNTIMGFTINIAAKATDTVDRLKKMIEEQEDIPFKKQILILDGVPLDDAQFLTDYTSSSSLHVLLRLQAGTGSSVGGASFVTPASSTMAAVPRKKNRLLGRGM